MNIAFYTGASGLRAYQNGVNVIAHNIANVDTPGFKYTNSAYRDLIYSNMDTNINRELDEDNKQKVGHGVKFLGQDMIFNQGNLQASEHQLDFAIAGECLFQIEREGSIEYTRNGQFDISVEGDRNYLVTSDGAYVLDKNGNHIEIPYDEQTGKILTGEIIEQFGLYEFDNPYGLYRTNQETFLVSNISGEPKQVSLDGPRNRVYAGAYERSNVNIAKEMSDLIVTQKSYQFSSKVVQTADEIEEIVNNLRK